MSGNAETPAAQVDNGAVAAERQDNRKRGEIALSALFIAFLRLGLSSFGGGTDGWVYRDFVERRHWLDDHEFLAGVALSRVLPGSGGVNLTVHVGRLLHGRSGALVAALGLLSGPLVVVIALAVLYARIAGNPAVHAVLTGVAAAAIGLALATGCKLAWRGDRGIVPFAIILATVLAVGILRWPMLPVILGLAPISIGFALIRVRRQGGND